MRSFLSMFVQSSGSRRCDTPPVKLCRRANPIFRRRILPQTLPDRIRLSSWSASESGLQFVIGCEFPARFFRYRFELPLASERIARADPATTLDRSRRIADIADRIRGRDSWAESGLWPKGGIPGVQPARRVAGDMAGRRLDGLPGGEAVLLGPSPQAQEDAPPRGVADGVEVLVACRTASKPLALLRSAPLGRVAPNF
jgi:hypothetical protein